MSHAELFEEKNILEDLKAGDKRAILEEMVETAVERGICPKSRKKAILEALFEREKLGSTGLGHGMAIPHVKVDGLQGQSPVFDQRRPVIRPRVGPDGRVDVEHALGQELVA